MRWTNGDQEVEAYYETGGTLFLLTHWESDPPCEGSCRLACVAGQPDADLDASPHYGCGEAADDPVVPCAS